MIEAVKGKTPLAVLLIRIRIKNMDTKLIKITSKKIIAAYITGFTKFVLILLQSLIGGIGLGITS